MNNDPWTKRCSDCKRQLPLSDFNKLTKSPDGHQERCRSCCSKYNAARYAAAKDRFKEAVCAYKEASPEQVFITRLRTWRKNPDDRKTVYKLMEAALNAGIIVAAKSCSICNIPAEDAGGHGLHKHHFDYAEPLSIVWLCTKCHGQLHKLIRDRQKDD